MKVLFSFVLSFTCFNLTMSSENTYRAAIVAIPDEVLPPYNYMSLVRDAAKLNADILVLPLLGLAVSDASTDLSPCLADNYDQIVKTVSEAANQSSLYVSVCLYEKINCQNKYEVFKSNLVFDRQGTVVSTYKKPMNTHTSCNSSATDIGVFTTDFSVTFGVLMDEDIVLQNYENHRNIKNFILTGVWSSDIPILTASHFPSTWAYTNDVNLVSTNGVYAGRADAKPRRHASLLVAELQKEGGLEEAITPPVFTPAVLQGFPREDLSQFIVKPLNLEASALGYKDTVCHEKFCCEFYVKTSFVESRQNDVNYGLAVHDGVRYFGRDRHIGTQSCALVACAGLYKRTCAVGITKNFTDVTFERISITGNFSNDNSAQFPVVVSPTGSPLSTDQFVFNIEPIDKKRIVSVVLYDIIENLSLFGIFGRDYLNDYNHDDLVSIKDNDKNHNTIDVYDFIYNEDVQEFFDYLWIRLRILIFVVSVYILEMM